MLEAVAGVPDIQVIFRGDVGQTSPQAVNRLMATFFHEGEQTWMPVRKFVAAKLASRALKSLVSDSTIRNPS
eukprot:617211-Hanusia_phi.AAC.1